MKTLMNLLFTIAALWVVILAGILLTDGTGLNWLMWVGGIIVIITALLIAWFRWVEKDDQFNEGMLSAISILGMIIFCIGYYIGDYPFGWSIILCIVVSAIHCIYSFVYSSHN